MQSSNLNKYDVVVAGGGPAGIGAAVAAARFGAKTLLIEKNSFLGGNPAAALVDPMMTFYAGERRVIGGIAQEIVEKMTALGGSPGHIPDPLGVTPTVVPFDIEIFKRVLFEIVPGAGADLLLHTFVTGIEVDGNVKSIQVCNKSGKINISAKVFVDATGDGDLSVFAGAPYKMGRDVDGLTQPMTMLFKLGGVNKKEIIGFIEKHPEEFILPSGGVDEKNLGVSGFFSLVKDAVEKKELTFERDRLLFFSLIQPDEVIVNTTRVPRMSGVDAFELTAAEIEGRRQVWELFDFMKRKVPGFKNSYIIQIGTQIGVRETRRIMGEYVMTAEDVIKGKMFEDGIACGSYPIDIHSPSGKELTWISMKQGTYYNIPLRSLLPLNTTNILTAGRCISATHEAMASTRIIPTSIAMGQAAGTAAAMSVEKDLSLRELPINELRGILQLNGAILI